MTENGLLEVIGDIDGKFILEADVQKKKAKSIVSVRGITRIAAVACIILFVAGVIFATHLNEKLSGSNEGNNDPAGEVPGGAMPVGGPLYTHDEYLKMLSVAVFPDTEKSDDVEAATLTELSKSDLEIMDAGVNEEAVSVPDHMKRYLPTALPEGYEFAHASLYETTMTSGEKYYLIRATYSNSLNETCPDELNPDQILIMVWNFNPGIERPIYTLNSITEDANEELKNYGIFLSVDDVFMSISLVDSWDDFETIIHSINTKTEKSIGDDG